MQKKNLGVISACILCAVFMFALIFKIRESNAACVYNAPFVSDLIYFLQAAPEGDTLVYRFLVVNQNSVDCPNETFTINVGAGVWPSFLSDSSITLSSGASQTITLTVNIPIGAGSGLYFPGGNVIGDTSGLISPTQGNLRVNAARFASSNSLGAWNSLACFEAFPTAVRCDNLCPGASPPNPACFDAVACGPGGNSLACCASVPTCSSREMACNCPVLPLAVPQIALAKTASVLVLPPGGGNVTYTYAATNPGTVALSDVFLNDNKCAPINFIGGDANGNSKLDLAETWIYTCTTNLAATTTNTASVSGWYNFITDFSSATTTVTVPVSLPACAIQCDGLPACSITLGDNPNLSWTATDTTSGILQPDGTALGGAFFPTGNINVSPAATTTYSLDLSGPGGTTNNACQVAVTVCIPDCALGICTNGCGGNCPIGTGCDDADSCTASDSCDGLGNCAGTAIVACNAGDSCCPTGCANPPDTDCGAVPCVENWSCTAWSACVAGNQTRTCTDSNSCGTVVDRPALSQACAIIPLPPPPACVVQADTAGLVPCGKSKNDPDTAWNECDPCTLCHLIFMFQLIIEFLVKIAAVVAVMSIAAGGFLYIFAAGNQGTLEKAKSIIKYVLIGFIIILIAWAVVDSILAAAGYIDPIGGEWYMMNC